MGQSRWTIRRRLKAGVYCGDRRDYEPGLRAGPWWLHWERWPFSLDVMIDYGALWIEVFRYA